MATQTAGIVALVLEVAPTPAGYAQQPANGRDVMSEWKLVPVDPTLEMLVNAFKECGGIGVGSCGEASPIDGDDMRSVYAAMLDAAPLPPCDTLTAEEARNKQHWKGMDGACAFHLIERHADGWNDVGLMMQAWLDANKGTP